MSRSIKVSENIWNALWNIKRRDNKKNLGEVISDLLTKAKEEIKNDTQSNPKAKERRLSSS